MLINRPEVDGSIAVRYEHLSLGMVHLNACLRVSREYRPFERDVAFIVVHQIPKQNLKTLSPSTISPECGITFCSPSPFGTSSAAKR